MPPAADSVSIYEGCFSRAAAAALVPACRGAFDVKSRGAGEAYSAGSTFLLRACDQPRGPLEKLARKIFDMHSAGRSFDAARSGAEWWTQCIDSRDDIGVNPSAHV